jgi:hypothetical protein
MKRARTAFEKASSGLKSQAAAVCASFALPSDFAPFRMRNEYTTEETALSHVFEEHQTFQSSGLPGANEQLLASQHLEFIFQDLLRNRISYVRNPQSVAWSYQWCFGRSAAAANLTTQTIFGSQDEYLVPSHAVATGGFTPHGPIYFAENDSGITGMWVDTGPAAASQVQVSFQVAPTSTTGTVLLYRWINGAWVEQGTLAITNAVNAYNFAISSVSAVYAIRIQGHANTLAAQVTHSGTCGCWGHFPSPYIVTNADSIESARVLGHSILIKNFTAPLYQDGDITGVQPGKSRVWTSFIGNISGTNDCFSMVRDYAKAENTRPLKTGLYGFIKPTDDKDLELREPFVIVPRSNGTSSDTAWTFAKTPILNTAYIVVAMATNQANQNIVCRTDTSSEFETGNQFFNVDKPRAEPQEWRDGMEALASMQQFYENPTHWKRILSTIGSIASVGGRILSLFGPKGAAVGVPVSMAGDIMKGGFQ